MLKWFRIQASRIAALALLSVLGMGVSAVALHGSECHDECAVVVAHDASAHQVRANATGGETHPLHCLVCHWARSFRPHTETRIISTPAVQAGDCIHVEFFTASSAAPVAQPPLRSPPISPVLA